METTFEKWYPCDNLDTMYDVHDVWLGQEGYSFILLSDGQHRKKLEGQRLMFTWESIVSYQLSEERYREDLWVSDPKQAWSFWKSTDSSYLNALRERSTLVPDGAVHWLFVGTNLIADVIAAQPPKVTVIAPNAGIAKAHRKECEFQGCVEVPMELSEDQLLDRFLMFIEENGWSFGGGERTIVDGYYINEDDTPGKPVWPEKASKESH